MGKKIQIIPEAPEGYKSWYDLYLEWDGKTKSLAYNLGNKLKTIDINILGQYVILEIYERNEKIIKLNEDLTAENTKFVTDIEGWIAEKIKHENEANRLRVENARLLTELESAEKDFIDKSIQSANRLVRINELEAELKKEVHNWAKEVDEKTDLQIELTSIKSKWWYKLMTWGWK